MATTFDEIYDLALVSIRDYKLDKLFDTSETDFKNYLEGFLKKAIPHFTNCKVDLEANASFSTDTFLVALSLKEQNILSELLTIEWFKKEINDVTQITMSMNDSDSKRYSESQNLKEKVSYYNIMREIVNQDMVDYGISNIPWADWAGGTYVL